MRPREKGSGNASMFHGHSAILIKASFFKEPFHPFMCVESVLVEHIDEQAVERVVNTATAVICTGRPGACRVQRLHIDDLPVRTYERFPGFVSPRTCALRNNSDGA